MNADIAIKESKLISKFENMKIDDTSSNREQSFGGNFNIITIDKNGKKRRKRKEKENGTSEHSVEKPKLSLGSSPFQLNEETPIKHNGKCVSEKSNGKLVAHEEEKKSSEDELNRLGESASKSGLDEDTNSNEAKAKKERQLKKKLRQIENLEQKKIKNGVLTPEEQEKINKKGMVLQQLESLKF